MATGADQAILACIRVPKSGSKSLSKIVAEALPDRTRFYLPDTLRREARISRWQAFRLWRSQAQNLSKHWGVLSLDKALAKIDAAAAPGDLLIGGHFDQPTVAAGLSRPVRSIVLLRDPADRARSDYNYARQGFLKKKPWQRFDAHLTAQAAGRYGFEGFLDYQLSIPRCSPTWPAPFSAGGRGPGSRPSCRRSSAGACWNRPTPSPPGCQTLPAGR